MGLSQETLWKEMKKDVAAHKRRKEWNQYALTRRDGGLQPRHPQKTTRSCFERRDLL